MPPREVIVWPRRDPLNGLSRESFEAHLRETLGGRVAAAYFFSDLLDIVPRMDILVYTPAEFEDLLADPSPGFWRSAVASLRRFL